MLVRPDRNAHFGANVPFLALHARRGDRGESPEDEGRLHEVLRVLAGRCRHWVVVSDDASTKARLAASLRDLGCLATTETDKAQVDEPAERLLADFQAMVGAAGVVCSVKGGWSSFPYAATRISGAPLLFTTELKEARIWRLFHAYSTVPIRGTHLGLAGAHDFCAALTQRGAAR